MQNLSIICVLFCVLSLVASAPPRGKVEINIQGFPLIPGIVVHHSGNVNSGYPGKSTIQVGPVSHTDVRINGQYVRNQGYNGPIEVRVTSGGSQGGTVVQANDESSSHGQVVAHW